MYILDTNVVSELRKAKKAHQNVKEWAQPLPSASLYISVISVLELEIGILLIERRDKEQGAILRAWMDRHVLPTFSGRILAIDTAVAQRCATLHVPNPRSDRDALIAATALVHGLTVVTKKVADFERMEVGVLNPWEHLSGTSSLYVTGFLEADNVATNLSGLGRSSCSGPR